MSRQKPNPKPPAPIGRAELELLTFVHDHSPATVRDAADHLFQTRGIGRTTVLNMMARLLAKGYVTRKLTAGIYQYSPRIQKHLILKNLIRDFVNSALGGSLSPFVAYLSTDADISDHELAELKKLLKDLERRKGEST